MYREKDLQDCLMGLVGFRQNDNPDYPTLPPSLLISRSGLFVQDQHPLLCIENLDQSLKNYDSYNFPAYDALVSYGLQYRVRFSDNKIYESLQATNVGNAPTDLNSTFWVEVGLLSQKLESVIKSAGGKVLADVFTQKKIDGATKSIFDNVQVFDGSGAVIDKEIKTGRFVGLAIHLMNQRDLTTIIQRLGTQFSMPNPAFKLYVYHSSMEDPIKVFELALVKSNSFEWSSLIDAGTNYILRALSDDHGPGGWFYIGYYEDDLVGQAINREYDFGLAPTCGSCSQNLELYNQWSKYFTIVPFAVSYDDLIGILPGDIGGPKLWDQNTTQLTYTKNYGLNFDLSVRCDVTDFICRESSIFTDALAKQITVDLLTAIAYSTRNNSISKEVKDMAMYELNNKPDYTPGAVKKLEKALAALSFDLTGLNGECLPCADRKGPTWGAF